MAGGQPCCARTSGMVASLHAWTSSEVLVVNHIFTLELHHRRDFSLEAPPPITGGSLNANLAVRPSALR